MKPTLVLDLDETLVHSTRATSTTTTTTTQTRLVSVEGVLYSVAKRPYVDEFLAQVSQWYTLVVFTASLRSYADPVVELLGIQGRRFYRDSCKKRAGEDGGYVKDLDLLGVQLGQLVVIDNSRVSFSNHRDNAILVSGWTADVDDRQLLDLIPLLRALARVAVVGDVRSVLGLKG